MGARRLLAFVGVTALLAPVLGDSGHSTAASDPSVARRPSVALASCYPPDNGNPELFAFTVTPATVDVRLQRQVVTFKALPRDSGGPGAATGVVGGWLSIGLTPDPADAFGARRMRWNGHGALVSRLRFWPEDVSGTWYVSLQLRDAAGNSTRYSARDLQAAGMPWRFTARTAARPDRDRPAIGSVRLSALAVDVGKHRKAVGIQVRATDDVAIAGVSAWMYGDRFFTTPTSYLRLRQGNRRNGVWRGRIVLPRIAGNDTANLIVDTWDFHGRYRKYLPRRLAEIGAPNEVQVHGHIDSHRPDPGTPRMTPGKVDLRGGAQKVTVRVRVTDRGAGVRKVLLTVSRSATKLQHQDYDMKMNRVSGTANDGVWEALVTLPPCEVEAGRWEAWVTAFDYALPGKSATSRRITVTNHDIAPPSADVVGNVPVSGPLNIRFDEPVIGVSTENMLVHTGLRVDDRPGDGPVPIAGTWACRDVAGSPVDCVTGPVRTAAFTPTTPFRADIDHRLLINPEHHLGLTDLVGNPAVHLFTDTVFLRNYVLFTPE